MIIMPIRVFVKRGQQSICPIRFCRAVTGPPVLDAPDVDDRGFAMGNRPATWGSTTAEGAMVGIRMGDTVRIKVLREDIENAADLYVTSSDTNLVEVVAPVNGGPLLNDGIFQIRGIVDRRNAPVKVEVRYGAVDGPIIGELEPHIYQEVTLRLAFHLVTIRGIGTTRSAADVRNFMPVINSIWRPCGIQFTLANANIVNETIRANPGGGADQYRRADGVWRPLPGTMAGHNFTHAGAVTSDARWADEYREFDTLISLNHRGVSINIYCVPDNGAYDNAGNHTTPDWSGLSYVNVNRNGGLALADIGNATNLAHEIGHFINNEHADYDNAGTDQGTTDDNIWLGRRLMFSQWPANAPPYKNDTGYGAGNYGALISVKKLAGTYSNSDGDLARSRRKARSII